MVQTGLRRVSVILSKSRRSVMDFEDFVNETVFLDTREKNLLLITGNEVCDNLLTHGEVGIQGITTCIRKQSHVLILAFYVESHYAFSEFAGCIDSVPVRKPRFDAEENRWHGLGLSMCANLARKISYRAGTKIDRVFLEFDPS